MNRNDGTLLTGDPEQDYGRGTSLLHNTGYGYPIQTYTLKRMRIHDGELMRIRLPPGISEVSWQSGDAREVLARAEQWWPEVLFEGAVILTPDKSRGKANDKGGVPLLLALNILGRTRGGIFLPSVPLYPDTELLQAKYVSADPRIRNLEATCPALPSEEIAS